MPLSDQELKDHPIWATRDGVLSAITDVREHADGPALEQIGLLHEALAAIERLADVPAWRFPVRGCLSDLDSALTQTRSTLQQVANSPASYAGSLAANLTAHLDTIATRLIACPVPAVTSGHMKGIAAAATEYRALVSDAMDRVQGKLAESQETVREIDNESKEIAALATAALEDLKNVIAQSKSEVTQQASRLDAAISTSTVSFTTKLNEWQTEFDTALHAVKATAGEQVAAVDVEAAKQRVAHQEAADESITKLKELEAQARNLVGVTARNAISTEYAQYARRQGGAATFWSVMTVIAAIAGFVYITTLLRNFDGVTVAEAVFKSTTSAAILGAAGFMGREAAGHRREARDAKRTQLDLNALEPFLATLAPENAETLRTQFAHRIFHRPLANSRRGLQLSRTPEVESDTSP